MKVLNSYERARKMGKYAVVTGASSGLGKEFAKQLAKRGYKLILTARREDRLQELEKEIGTKCIIIPADLSKKEECLRFFEEIQEKKVEVFINNAGFGDCNFFVLGDLEKELDMIDLNVKAMHILMKLMLKKMHQENQGYILNVASSAGLFPAGPFMATYYATKAYVTSITQAVAEELRETGSHVYVGALCPGPVDTEFNSVANVEFALKGIKADDCVEYALEKMFKKKIIIVPAATIKMAVAAGKLSPRAVAVRITAGQQKRKLGK